MSGTCKTVNFSWLLFATLMIGRNPSKTKHPLKMEFKDVLFCRMPFCKFMLSLCKNENTPM